MAKKQKNEHAGPADPVSADAAPTSAPASPVGSAIESRRPGAVLNTPSVSVGAGWLDPVGETLIGSVQILRGLLPESRVPLFLASSALLVTGLIDPPVALGAGLAVEALRRWEPLARR